MAMKTIVIYDSTEKNILRRVFVVPEKMPYHEAVSMLTDFIKRSGIDSVEDLDRLELSNFLEETGFVGLDLKDIVSKD
jgi:hypothetical protein